MQRRGIAAWWPGTVVLRHEVQWKGSGAEGNSFGLASGGNSADNEGGCPSVDGRGGAAHSLVSSIGGLRSELEEKRTRKPNIDAHAEGYRGTGVVPWAFCVGSGEAYRIIPRREKITLRYAARCANLALESELRKSFPKGTGRAGTQVRGQLLRSMQRMQTPQMPESDFSSRPVSQYPFISGARRLSVDFRDTQRPLVPVTTHPPAASTRAR